MPQPLLKPTMKVQKIVKYITALSLTCLLGNAYAADSIYCTEGLVKEIQSQDYNVLVLVDGLGWKQLGTYEEKYLPTRLSLALSAHASGKKLMLAFPVDSGVDCPSHEWGTSPVKVRIMEN